MKKYWINFAFYFSFQIVSINHISGQCSPNNSPCDDGNACTYDICVDGVCLYFNNSNSCDDGNPCTINDVCINGVCQGTPKSCSDGNPCTDDFCDPVTGNCYFVINNSLSCSDGNLCTTNDYCFNGVCTGTPTVCSDGNPCTLDNCNPTIGCFYTNNSNSCDDGNPCTINDVCMNGVCQGISPATYTVTSQTSFGIGSLRHRIINSCQGDTIIFDPNVDTVYLDQFIYLPHSIIIKGNGVNNTIINGQLVTQAFTILSTQILHLENLSMINCKSSTNSGAFFNQGIVKMKHVSFKNNYEGSSNKAFTNANEVIITQAGTVYITD